MESLKGKLMKIWKFPYILVFIYKIKSWKFRILIPNNSRVIRCVKRVLILSFCGPYFPAIKLKKDQKNSEYRHFSRSDLQVCIFL